MNVVLVYACYLTGHNVYRSFTTGRGGILLLVRILFVNNYKTPERTACVQLWSEICWTAGASTYMFWPSFL